MKAIQSADPYESTKRKIAAERKAAWRRAFVVTIVAAIGAGLGFAWPDHASFFGAMRAIILGTIGGTAAVLLTRPSR